MIQRAEEIIDQIYRVYDELRRLEVYPKVENLRRMSDEQLAAELDAVSDQLKTRKRFLGVN